MRSFVKHESVARVDRRAKVTSVQEEMPGLPEIIERHTHVSVVLTIAEC